MKEKSTEKVLAMKITINKNVLKIEEIKSEA
jgi:hypothetical protein